jgi:NAD-dependent deacetylase
MLRPDVVLFGDLMPEAFRRAIEAVAASGMLLVVGSSLAVYPASSLAEIAPRLAVINREATPFDHRAEVVIHGGAGESLAALADALL